MKKLHLTALLALAALALTACASSAGQPNPATKTIGIVQLIDNGAFTDTREGFLDRMKTLGYGEDQVAYNYKNAQGDVSALNTICQEMADAKTDLVVTIATPPTQAMVNLKTEIPVFYINVSNPVEAGVITDLEHPDKNATGASNAIPFEEIQKLADSLTPGIRTYGLLYSNGEVNAVATIKLAKAALDASGAAYREAIVTNSSEVQQAVQTLLGNVDAIFVPNDSVVQAALPQVAQLCREQKIPLYGSSAVMVASGALATVSTDDRDIGALAADMVDTYLKGTAISEIPAVRVSTFKTVLNFDTVNALNLTLPEGLEGNAIVLKDEGAAK